MVTSPFISIVWCFRPYKPYIFWKLIIWWWQWPRRILTERQRHTYTDKDKYKVLPRPNVCLFIKSRGFKDLKYYIGCLLVMTKTKTRFYALLGLNNFQGSIFSRSEYFSVFQEWIFFRGDYFSGVNIYPGWIFSVVDIFQGWIFFRGEYFSWVNIFHGWIFFMGD